MPRGKAYSPASPSLSSVIKPVAQLGLCLGVTVARLPAKHKPPIGLLPSRGGYERLKEGSFPFLLRPQLGCDERVGGKHPLPDEPSPGAPLPRQERDVIAAEGNLVTGLHLFPLGRKNAEPGAWPRMPVFAGRHGALAAQALFFCGPRNASQELRHPAKRGLIGQPGFPDDQGVLLFLLLLLTHRMIVP